MRIESPNNLFEEWQVKDSKLKFEGLGFKEKGCLGYVDAELNETVYFECRAIIPSKLLSIKK